jgi:Domain of unknown function (DUF6471)
MLLGAGAARFMLRGTNDPYYVANATAKPELKRAEISYAELAPRLKEHGLKETEASITAKLKRGTFAATFFLAMMKAIGSKQVNLADL